MPKSYLVVGGSSDIAILVSDLLLDDGHSVTILARDISRVESLKSRGAHVIQGDALDQETVSTAIGMALEAGDKLYQLLL